MSSWHDMVGTTFYEVEKFDKKGSGNLVHNYCTLVGQLWLSYLHYVSRHIRVKDEERFYKYLTKVEKYIKVGGAKKSLPVLFLFEIHNFGHELAQMGLMLKNCRFGRASDSPLYPPMVEDVITGISYLVMGVDCPYWQRYRVLK